MSPRETFALRDYLDPGLTGRTLSDARHSASLSEITDQTCLKGRLAELSGRAALLALRFALRRLVPSCPYPARTH